MGVPERSGLYLRKFIRKTAVQTAQVPGARVCGENGRASAAAEDRVSPGTQTGESNDTRQATPRLQMTLGEKTEGEETRRKLDTKRRDKEISGSVLSLHTCLDSCT